MSPSEPGSSAPCCSLQRPPLFRSVSPSGARNDRSWPSPPPPPTAASCFLIRSAVSRRSFCLRAGRAVQLVQLFVERNFIACPNYNLGNRSSVVGHLGGVAACCHKVCCSECLYYVILPLCKYVCRVNTQWGNELLGPRMCAF